MIGPLARLAKGFGIDTGRLYRRLSAASLQAALDEQGLADLMERLRTIAPDISDQYSSAFDSADYAAYWEVKMRGLHAAQVAAALDALSIIRGDELTVVDIGDSAGTHGQYLRALAPEGKMARVLSVNLDPVAIDKIRAKGGDAVLGRAEDLDVAEYNAALFCLFETLEHLSDPLRFLHRLATGAAAHVLVSVPYRRHSRFGDDHLRLAESAMPEKLTAEQVHIYEFSPADWALLARFAGYRVVFQRIYRQYPRRSIFRLTAPLWRRLDFEGFLIMLLERDLGVAERYVDW
jgi:hypothetical protein